MLRPIVLVGLMGAGKTSVGKRLAPLLGASFIDLDDYIEEKNGVTISQIFDFKGEEHFRELEEKYLRDVLENEKVVVATGGGAFTREANRKFIKEKAVSVWLTAGIKTTLERVSRNNKRPLLQTGDKETILRKLADERYPLYGQADIKVNTDKGKPLTIAENIIREIRKLEELKNSQS